MKNMNIKLANAIVGFSVVVGVVLISSGIVFGADPVLDGVHPTFTGLTINGNADTTGDLTVGGEVTLNYINSPNLGMGATEVTVNSPFLFLNQIRMQDSFSTEESIHADQFISASRDITAGGKITSTGHIGKFYRVRSAAISVPAMTTHNSVQACPVGIAVSCSAWPAFAGSWRSYYAGLISAPTTDANGVYGCTLSMYNSHAVQALTVYNYNVCFDSTGTAIPGSYALNL